MCRTIAQVSYRVLYLSSCFSPDDTLFGELALISLNSFNAKTSVLRLVILVSKARIPACIYNVVVVIIGEKVYIIVQVFARGNEVLNIPLWSSHLEHIFIFDVGEYNGVFLFSFYTLE